ncbi:MAG: type secretion system protein GspF [Pseudomonadota bacterium]
MPVYEYKGFDAAGAAVTGLVDADTVKTARSKLRKQNVFPTDVKEQTGAAVQGAGLNREIDLKQYLEFITVRDISVMTQQLAVLINAAVPVAESLGALVDQTEKAKLRVVLSKVREDVNGGRTLGDAMSAHPKVFDTLYISMIKAGERSGALGQVLERLSKFADESVRLQGQVVSALAYPALMASVGSLMIIGIFVGVLPKMRTIFDSFGDGEADLPFVSQLVFGFGDLLVAWWWALPIAVFGGLWLFRRWVATKPGRATFDRFKLTMPVFGRMNRLVAVSRFCRTLGTLLVSGVPILAALGIVRDIVGNVVMSEAIQAAGAAIQEGQSIARPLKESGQFPPMVIHMIQVGERTGELEQMLNLIANAYESEVEATIKGAMSLLGPITIIGMGGVVFVVALGLLLPMQQMMSMVR